MLKFRKVIILLPPQLKLFKLKFRNPCKKCLIAPMCSSECMNRAKYLNWKYYMFLIKLNSIKYIKGTLQIVGILLFGVITNIIVASAITLFLYLCYKTFH